MSEHEVFRQVSYVQQSLSQNKKNLGFFIGAGCPLSIRVNEREVDGQIHSDPLIPDVAGLTTIINEKLSASKEDNANPWNVLMDIIREDGGKTENIEYVLTKVRLLASVVGNLEIRGLRNLDLTKLDRDICGIISSEVNKTLPNKQSPYHHLAVWARSVRREQAVHIFTTNYDLLLEQALEESSAPYFDGFIGAREAFFDLGAVEDEKLLPPRWTRLWKIHGSLNWRLNTDNRVIRSYELKPGQQHLIYPSHLKYDQSRKMPYLAMLDRLKEFLLKPSSILFLSGYSFNDEHINDVICTTLSANPTAHVFAFMHGKLAQYTHAINCGKETPNLTVLAFDQAIIGRIDGKWTRSSDPATLPEGIVKGDEGSEDVELKLGDFSEFGSLLRSLAGTGEANG